MTQLICVKSYDDGYENYTTWISKGEDGKYYLARYVETHWVNKTHLNDIQGYNEISLYNIERLLNNLIKRWARSSYSYPRDMNIARYEKIINYIHLHTSINEDVCKWHC